MNEQRPSAHTARTVFRETLDISDTTQVASELQRRIYKLTSTWTGAPVEVHRTQETVSRACMVLQSIVHFGSEASPDGASGAGRPHQRPVYEQLCRQLTVTKKSLQSLIDIM